jgi:hypothetical protein
LLCFLTLVTPCASQTAPPRDDILRLIPPDTGLCLIVNDLRGNSGKLQDAAWIKRLTASSLGKAVTLPPQFTQLRTDLQKYLQVNLSHLRDDIFADLIVFAYKPPPPGQSQQEQGLVLLWARNPELLAQVMERLNKAQIKDNQLKEVVAVDYKGKKYYCRVEQDKTHYYFLEGALFAFTGQETVIRQVIERRQKKGGVSDLSKKLDRAGAGSSLAALWINPRAFDADLKQKAKDGTKQETLVLKAFFSYWQALEGIVLSLDLGDSVAVRLTLQARTEELPKSVRPLFTETKNTSELWSRFPKRAILRIVGRINTIDLFETLADLTPPDAGQVNVEKANRIIKGFLDLDLVKDVLPNIGPDWGLCIAPGPDKNDLPHVLAAVAVRPGSGKIPVDRGLLKGIRFLAELAVLQYNFSHPDPIRLKKLDQGGVEIHYLANDKVFPPGFQPAFALKDGYLLLASSPEAIGQFQKTGPPSLPSAETPLVDLSLRELAKFLKARRQKAIGFLASQNQINEETAGQLFDGLLASLDLFDQLLLSERRQTGQVTWTLRLGNIRK